MVSPNIHFIATKEIILRGQPTITNLTSEILDEYLKTYHIRTEWLSEKFPNSAAAFRYFEWSFMISMVEKINRLQLSNCESQLKKMYRELSTHREEFLQAPETLDFEREWIGRYIK